MIRRKIWRRRKNVNERRKEGRKEGRKRAWKSGEKEVITEDK